MTVTLGSVILAGQHRKENPPRIFFSKSWQKIHLLEYPAAKCECSKWCVLLHVVKGTSGNDSNNGYIVAQSLKRQTTVQ